MLSTLLKNFDELYKLALINKLVFAASVLRKIFELTSLNKSRNQERNTANTMVLLAIFINFLFVCIQSFTVKNLNTVVFNPLLPCAAYMRPSKKVQSFMIL